MSSSSSSSSSWSSTSALHSSTPLVTPTNSAGDTPVVSHSVADIAGADELLRDGFDDSPPLNPKLQRFQLNMFTETNDENLVEPKGLSTRLVGARGPNIPKLSASRAFSVNDLVSYENMFEKVPGTKFICRVFSLIWRTDIDPCVYFFLSFLVLLFNRKCIIVCLVSILAAEEFVAATRGRKRGS